MQCSRTPWQSALSCAAAARLMSARGSGTEARAREAPGYSQSIFFCFPRSLLFRFRAWARALLPLQEHLTKLPTKKGPGWAASPVWPRNRKVARLYDTKTEDSMDFMFTSSLNQQSSGLLQSLASCAPHLMTPPPANSARGQLFNIETVITKKRERIAVIMNSQK